MLFKNCLKIAMVFTFFNALGQDYTTKAKRLAKLAKHKEKGILIEEQVLVNKDVKLDFLNADLHRLHTYDKDLYHIAVELKSLKKSSHWYSFKKIAYYGMSRGGISCICGVGSAFFGRLAWNAEETFPRWVSGSCSALLGVLSTVSGVSTIKKIIKHQPSNTQKLLEQKRANVAKAGKWLNQIKANLK